MAQALVDAVPIYLKASASYEKYYDTDRVEDLDIAIGLYRKLDQLEDFEDNLIYLRALRRFACALYKRSNESQDPHEQQLFLTECVSIYRRIRKADKTDTEDLDDHLRVLRKLYDISNDSATLDEFIELYRTSAEFRIDGSTKRMRHLMQLVALLTRRFTTSATPSVDDLEEVARHCSRYLPEENSAKLKPRDRYFISGHLSFALISLYELQEGPTSLDDAIQICDNIVSSSTPKDNIFYPQFMYFLASGLMDRYAQSMEYADIERATRLLEQFIPLLPPEPKDRFIALRRYGQALYSSFLHPGKGDIRHLNTAVQVFREALASCSHDDDRYIVFQELAECLSSTFQHPEARSRVSLDEALVLFTKVLGMATKLDDRVGILNNLGSVMVNVEELSHARCDLDTAIGYYRDGLKISPISDDTRFNLLMNLGTALYRLWAVSREVSHIRESVACLRQAIPIGSTSPDDWRLLHNSATTLSLFVAIQNDDQTAVVELQTSVDWHQQALSLHADGPDCPTVLNQLGVTLRRLYGHSKTSRNLDDALLQHETALPLCPLGVVDHSRTLYLLGLALFTRYLSSKEVETLRKAINMFSRAATDPYTPAHTRYSYVDSWIKACTESSDFRDSTSEAYAQAISLLPQMAKYGLDVRARLQYLSRAAGVACDAANHALTVATDIASSNGAVELLEEGRSVFWRQALRLRNPSEKRLDADISERLLLVSKELDAQSYSAQQVSIAVEADRRRQLASEFEDLVKEARRIRGLENFLLPDPYKSLSLAARDGPVVILIPGKTTCYAVMIKNSLAQSEKLLLNGVGVKNIHGWQKALDSMNQMSRSRECAPNHPDRTGRPVLVPGRESSEVRYNRVLKEMWTKVVKPVFLQLGLQVSSEFIFHL